MYRKAHLQHVRGEDRMTWSASTLAGALVSLAAVYRGDGKGEAPITTDASVLDSAGRGMGHHATAARTVAFAVDL